MQVSTFSDSLFKPAYGIECSGLPSSFLKEGLYPTFCKVASFASTNPHAHFEPELFYIIKGTGLMTIETKTQEVKEGDLIRIPSMKHHTLTNIGEGELHFLSVYSEDSEVPTLPASVIVTSAPPTPNGPLHLGHISGPYLASDLVTRHLRSQGKTVRAHSGTDDHQNYVAERARLLSIDSEAFRIERRNLILQGLKTFDIQYDEFIEPKFDEKYKTNLQHFFQRAIDLGVINEEVLPFPYCEACELHLFDAKLQGSCPHCGEASSGGCESCGLVVLPHEVQNQSCTRCKTPASSRLSCVHTFNVSQHLPLIKADLSGLTIPSNVKKMIDTVTEKSDHKVLVSHPFDDDQLHVWFEMAAHYEQFATGPDFWIHCFGFDNAFNYLVYIPALLKAMNEKARLPDAVVINQFLTLDGLKFSTSRNHALWAHEFKGNADHLRLYLSLQRPNLGETDFTMKSFEQFSLELGKKLSSLQVTKEDDQLSLRSCERLKRDFLEALSLKAFNPKVAARLLMNFLEDGIDTKEKMMTFTRLSSLFMPHMGEQV